LQSFGVAPLALLFLPVLITALARNATLALATSLLSFASLMFFVAPASAISGLAIVSGLGSFLVALESILARGRMKEIADLTGRVNELERAEQRRLSLEIKARGSKPPPSSSIVGNIECNSPAQVVGRIEGELRASDLLISDGAQVEGNVIAQNVTVCGRVKGTIRAVRVKLQDGGAVEGDILVHRSLSIDENSQFEGSSQRVENPTDPSSSVDAKGLPKKDKQSPALAPLPSIDAELTVGSKH
jgi:cytoskeletal protein CcmA (bactofilin family)